MKRFVRDYPKNYNFTMRTFTLHKRQGLVSFHSVQAYNKDSIASIIIIDMKLKRDSELCLQITDLICVTRYIIFIYLLASMWPVTLLFGCDCYAWPISILYSFYIDAYSVCEREPVMWRTQMKHGLLSREHFSHHSSLHYDL
jgi:hypothetical protein